MILSKVSIKVYIKPRVDPRPSIIVLSLSPELEVTEDPPVSEYLLEYLVSGE